MLTVLPVIAVATHLYRKRSRQMYREVRTQNAIVTGHLAENISGVRVVQAFAREDANLQQLRRASTGRICAGLLKATAFSSGFGPVIIFISTVATVVVIWFGGQRVLAGVMTVGSLYAFLAYVGRFFEPINDLSSKYNSMQAAMAGGERVFELLDTPPAVQDRPGAYALPAIEGDVVFEDVVFEYVPDRPVLRGISLHANPGDVVALVGHTGAGKSSIINILLRFYDIKSGSITIDGHDIRDVTTREPAAPGGARAAGPLPLLREHPGQHPLRAGWTRPTSRWSPPPRPSTCTTSSSRSPSATTPRCRSGGAPSPRASASCSPSPGP